jgi:hypothetical protein
MRRYHLFSLPLGALLAALALPYGLARGQDSGFLVQIAGRGPSATGAIDSIRAARGLFAIIPIVVIRARAGSAITVAAQGFKLADANGNFYPVSDKAMQTLNPSFTGQSINLDSNTPQQQVFLIFDVPAMGAYRLTGPGIGAGGIQYDVR